MAGSVGYKRKNSESSAGVSGKCTPGGKKKRKKAMGGGMMMDTPRAMYKGGGLCTKGMGRAYGKNS